MKALPRGLIVSLLFVTWSAAGVGGNQSPPDQPSPTQSSPKMLVPEPALTVDLPMLVYNLGEIGGQSLRVRDLYIEHVDSPQRFVVRTRHDEFRAFVLLQRPGMRALVKGVRVEVWGRAYTAAGASIELGWPSNLTRDVVSDYKSVPVIRADAVRSPDGVVLY
jgi:hypothetical protein